MRNTGVKSIKVDLHFEINLNELFMTSLLFFFSYVKSIRHETFW